MIFLNGESDEEIRRIMIAAREDELLAHCMIEGFSKEETEAFVKEGLKIYERSFAMEIDFSEFENEDK